MASDGAAVMIGARSGVMTRVRLDVPHLVSVHCTAHRLELSLKSALKQTHRYSEIEDFLVRIYKFYNNSPRNLAALSEAGNANGIVILKPGNVLGTRWIDHHKRAIEAIDRDWLSMVVHMQDITTPGSDHTADSKQKARGFLEKLTQVDFVKDIYIQLDIYRILGRLSLLFQRNDASVETVKFGLKSAVDNLQLLLEQPGPSETLFNESFNDGRFRGIELNPPRRRTNADVNAGDGKAAMLNSCIREINNRFRPFREDPVLTAANVFDPTDWPQDINELRNYGRDEIVTLARHFRDLLERHTEFSEDEALMEWTGLKTTVNRILAANPGLRFLDIWHASTLPRFGRV
ncbi:zinc finger protein 862-like [Ptychodera flava]|uniref:zinc finger protein 862-like n=1 Tax=Ptychodera flava TaxID=63121 RepID=UPI00396A9791